jgi:rubrerythrin
MTADEVKPSEGRRLAELRRAHPTDSTLENLLSVLRAELDLCARLPLFAYEATTEGHDECASLLGTLAETERAHVEKVLATLQRHLEARSGRTEVSG